MVESFAVNEDLHTHHPRSAVIIGGGYIGMEMADTLTHRGLVIKAVLVWLKSETIIEQTRSKAGVAWLFACFASAEEGRKRQMRIAGSQRQCRRLGPEGERWLLLSVRLRPI